MKRLFAVIALMTAILSTGNGLMAQKPVYKIDFNMLGRKVSEVNEESYSPWAVRSASGDSMSFTAIGDMSSSVKIILTAVQPTKNALSSSYYKTGVLHPNNARLVCDGFNTNSENGAVVEICIQGLPVGQHRIQTYHNIWSLDTDPNSLLRVYADGNMVHDSIVCTLRALHKDASTVLLTNVSVKEKGQAVVLRFEAIGAKPDQPSCQNVWINALEINTKDVRTLAKKPFPTDGDIHANADAGYIQLHWTAAEGMIKHQLYIGTDSAKIASAKPSDKEYKGEISATNYRIEDLYSMNTYYWRIDEVDAQGNVFSGNVWRFRPRHLAFRDAEGYGRFATGGRGGKVVYVTNLNDSGEGSFREAVTQDIGPRTIVFAVSGIIRLESRLICSSKYVTIAGQTAPGKGICFRAAPFGVGGEGICRFVRLRLGGGQTYDGMGMNGNQSIMDHCSISWTIDEGFSSRGSKNITLQRTMISEALNIAGHKNYRSGKGHGYAATIGGDTATFHHNLLAHCAGRNWSLGGGLDADGRYAGHLDLFNNVVYNWQHRATDGGAHEVNFVNNYYKEGIATTKHVTLNAQLEGVGKGSQSYYYTGNVLQAPDGSFLCDGTDSLCGKEYHLSNGQILDWEVWANQPFFPSHAKIESAQDAYKSVLSDVGCNMPLFDEHDQRIVRETMTGTYTYTGSLSKVGGIIDDEADAGGYENYPELTRAENYDSDWDGLPDWWEKLYKSNPNSTRGDFSDSNADQDKDGYTALEDYLDWMAVPHFYIEQGKKMTIDLSAFASAYTEKPVYTISCSAMNLKNKGSKVQIKAPSDYNGLFYLTFTVEDADGSRFTRRIGVCIMDVSEANL